MSKMIVISKEDLKDLYENKKFNTYQIAKQIGCCQATVWKRLIKFKIKRRTPYELNSNVPSKKDLTKHYIKENLSTWEIEKKYGFSRGTIHRMLKEYKIPIRDRAIAHIINPRKNFSENLTEKAYLIGFRLGDLGVRKIYPNSKTISVASGSTIKEQIELINNLFKDYGKVKKSTTKKGKTNIWVALNESFDFLLSKDFPEWIRKKEDHFFSFLAGFTDAEGSMGIYKKMAKYTLGNYDKKLLLTIHENLKTFGINTNKPSSDNRKGKLNSQGYAYKNNYWQLMLCRKTDLEHLLKKLQPYLKHPLKIKALNTSLRNIELRNKRKYGN